MKFLAILTLASLAFGAGWVMRGKKDKVDDYEPRNNEEDQSKNLFV